MSVGQHRHIPQTDVTVTFTLREAAELHTLVTGLMRAMPDHHWSRQVRGATGVLRAALEKAGARANEQGEWII